jgi:hypothetical protein
MLWLCATLQGWVTSPPAAASRPMRRLCDSRLVALVRRVGGFPRAVDLIMTFCLRPRAAKRRHAELTKLVRRAASDFDAT